MKEQLLRGCMHPQRKLVVLMGSFSLRGCPADSSVQIRRSCTTTPTHNTHSAPQTSSFALKPSWTSLHSLQQSPLSKTPPQTPHFPTHSFTPKFFFFPPTDRWHHPHDPALGFLLAPAATDSLLSAWQCQSVSMASWLTDAELDAPIPANGGSVPGCRPAKCWTLRWGDRERGKKYTQNKRLKCSGGRTHARRWICGRRPVWGAPCSAACHSRYDVSFNAAIVRPPQMCWQTHSSSGWQIPIHLPPIIQ